MHVHESRSFLYTGDSEGRPMAPDEGLPDITHTWKHFDGVDPTAEKQWKSRQFVDRGETARRFIDGIVGCEGRCLHFLHVMLPHFPWQYDEGGRKYLPHGVPELKGDVWGS